MKTLKNAPSLELSSSRDGEIDDLIREIAHAPPRSPPLDAASGTRWAADGRYVIHRRLGRGGMGTVYSAEDTLLGRTVALKVLDSGSSGDEVTHRERLLREARIAARVEHDRIARVYDVGEHEGSLFVAMELINGSSLRTTIDASARVPPETIVRLLSEIAEGLAELHTRGVVHRDLKPENIMLTERAGIKLVDFGLAHSSSAPLSSAFLDDAVERREASVGTLAGTPAYMAPEQWLGGEVDARVDVFAFGVVAFELATGARPFGGSSVREVRALTLESDADFHPATWRRLPSGLRAVVARCLARGPAERFRDGIELAGAVKAAVEARDGLSPGAAAPSRPFAPRRRTLFLTITALLVLSSAGAVRWRRAREAHHAAPEPGMAWLDPGPLTVGSTEEEVQDTCKALGSRCDLDRLRRELPQASVTVPAFELDVHEVTNAQMVALLNTLSGSLHVVDDEDDHTPRYVRFNAEINPRDEFLADLYPPASDIEKDGFLFKVKPGRESFPVTQVTWFGANLFCSSHGKRLPTDDEVEAAERGAGNRPFPWGSAEVAPGGVLIPREGFVPMSAACAEAPPVVAVGASFQDVTPEGIHDLGGNLAEWTASAYLPGKRGVPIEATNEILPRIIRGGSFGDSFLARSRQRTWRLPNTVGANVGFRCAAN